MLEVRDLTVTYGRGKRVLHDINVSFDAAEMAVIMGHNGAGKTTLLNALFGILPPERGEVRFKDQVLRGGTAERVRRGIAYSPSGQAVLPRLSVGENLDVAAAVVRADHDAVATRRDTLFALFPVLRERRRQIAGSLSGGQRRMLSLGMMLMQGPAALLLDEPSLGLSPRLVEEVYAALARIRAEFGVTVVAVEQSINPTILRADRLHILRMGRIVLSGGSDVLSDPQRLWSLL